jgi:hypothetical protein
MDRKIHKYKIKHTESNDENKKKYYEKKLNYYINLIGGTYSIFGTRASDDASIYITIKLSKDIVNSVIQRTLYVNQKNAKIDISKHPAHITLIKFDVSSHKIQNLDMFNHANFKSAFNQLIIPELFKSTLVSHEDSSYSGEYEEMSVFFARLYDVYQYDNKDNKMYVRPSKIGENIINKLRDLILYTVYKKTYPFEIQETMFYNNKSKQPLRHFVYDKIAFPRHYMNLWEPHISLGRFTATPSTEDTESIKNHYQSIEKNKAYGELITYINLWPESMIQFQHKGHINDITMSYTKYNPSIKDSETFEISLLR